MFIKAGWFPVIVKRDEYTRYIEALERADADDLRSLVAMFVEAQRNAVIQATEVAYDVRPLESVDEAIAAARGRLLQRGTLPLKDWLAAKTSADQLTKSATQRFGEIAEKLTKEIGSVGRNFSFSAGANQGSSDSRRTEVVQKAGQVPDFGEYNTLVHLYINTDRPAAFILSFHGIGPRFRGFIGVVAFLSWQGKEPSLIPIEGGTFQINYEEDLASAQSRFSKWVEHVIVEGLNEWRRNL